MEARRCTVALEQQAGNRGTADAGRPAPFPTCSGPVATQPGWAAPFPTSSGTAALPLGLSLAGKTRPGHDGGTTGAGTSSSGNGDSKASTPSSW
ncbi:unnamed protein product [Polarella glacialis]|uniref:Uncharacterized protein n=1 Tax=Polarella glacialis TaxID=89957 RepID=A0A813IZ21_POLGL|nr:unnamed protein product [Polarella glacialis]CAE8670969.1 unnamed protein product [Polarella glacialis]